MRKLRIKWLIWTSKVLVSVISLLGLSSCWFQPKMYGVPDSNWMPDSVLPDSLVKDSAAKKEFRAMYSVRPTIYKQNVIDKEGVDIEIRQD